MNAKTLTALSSPQQEWLWVRYVQLFPPCEADSDAHRHCADSWSKSSSAVKQQVERWRTSPPFTKAEEELKEGITIESALEVVEHYLAAAAVLAIQERTKLVQIPWFDEEGNMLSGRAVEAKAVAISQVLKMLGEYRQKESAKKPAEVLEDIEDLRSKVHGRS